MIHRIIALGVFLLLAAPAFAYEKTQGWCEDGGVAVSIPGTQGSGSQRFQQSFRSCNVTVYDAGTLNVATIYSDAIGTPQANPFTASSLGRWSFYAKEGRYDVRFSSGGMSAPFTIGDIPVGGTTTNCNSVTGADAGIIIQRCINALPTTGGFADARLLLGAQTATSTITISTDNVTLLLPPNGVASSASPVINVTGANVTIVGANKITEFGAVNAATILSTSHATGDIINIAGSANHTQIQDIQFRCTSGARTGGAAIHVAQSTTNSNGVYVSRVNMEPCYKGIYMEGFTYGVFDSVTMGANTNTSAAAVWYAPVHLEGDATHTVTETVFRDLVISVDRNCSSGGCIFLNGATDSPTFEHVSVIASGTTCGRDGGTGSCGAMMLVADGAIGTTNRWLRCTDCFFEAGVSDPDIKVTKGDDLRFTNSYIASGRYGLWVAGSAGCAPATGINGLFWEGSIYYIQRNNVKIDRGCGIQIYHSQLGQGSVETNNTYPIIDVGVNAAQGGVQITENYFGDGIFNTANKANYDIQIANGVSDYVITKNFFVAASRATGDINDLNGSSASVDRMVAFNLPLATSWTLPANFGAVRFNTGYGTVSPTFNDIVIGGGGTAPDSGSIQFGDGSGYRLRLGPSVAGVFTPRFDFYDNGAATLGVAGQSVTFGGYITYTGVAFASLGAPSNGTTVYCNNCAPNSNPCAGASTGAIAKRLNGAWDCR